MIILRDDNSRFNALQFICKHIDGLEEKETVDTLFPFKDSLVVNAIVSCINDKS